MLIHGFQKTQRLATPIELVKFTKGLGLREHTDFSSKKKYHDTPNSNHSVVMLRVQRINHALSSALKPAVLLIDDESHRHQVPAGAESHFKITMVSTHFEQLTRVARHRLVMSILKDEFEIGLHALSLFLYTPLEWEEKKDKIPPSPPCRNHRTN